MKRFVDIDTYIWRYSFLNDKKKVLQLAKVNAHLRCTRGNAFYLDAATYIQRIGSIGFARSQTYPEIVLHELDDVGCHKSDTAIQCRDANRVLRHMYIYRDSSVDPGYCKPTIYSGGCWHIIASDQFGNAYIRVRQNGKCTREEINNMSKYNKIMKSIASDLNVGPGALSHVWITFISSVTHAEAYYNLIYLAVSNQTLFKSTYWYMSNLISGNRHNERIYSAYGIPPFSRMKVLNYVTC